MIVKARIFKGLKTLDALYKRSSHPLHALYYSKIAILELCGWIEESMDDIIKKCAKRKLNRTDNLQYIRKDVVKRTFGFEYDNTGGVPTNMKAVGNKCRSKDIASDIGRAMDENRIAPNSTDEVPEDFDWSY